MSRIRCHLRAVDLFAILLSLIFLGTSPAPWVQASPVRPNDGPVDQQLTVRGPLSIWAETPVAAWSPQDLRRAHADRTDHDNDGEGEEKEGGGFSRPKNTVERRSLVKRGSCFSKDDQGGVERYECDGNLPTTAEIAEMITRWNRLPGRASIFYTNLGAAGGMKSARQWLNCHTDVVPANGYVMFDDVVDPAWVDAKGAPIHQAHGKEGVDYFQKLISQAFAEQTVGTAYLFAPYHPDPLTILNSEGIATAWRGWEYPALTRNSRVTSIVAIDPRPQVAEDDPNKRRVIWEPSHGPSPNPPLGTNRHGPSP